MGRQVLATEVWRLRVEKGPSEHGVYKFGYLWLAPTEVIFKTYPLYMVNRGGCYID